MLIHPILKAALPFSPLLCSTFTYLQEKCCRIPCDPKCHVPNLSGYTWGTDLISICAERSSAGSHLSPLQEQALRYALAPRCARPSPHKAWHRDKCSCHHYSHFDPMYWVCRKLPGVITLLPILKVFQLNLKSNYSPEVTAGY